MNEKLPNLIHRKFDKEQSAWCESITIRMDRYPIDFSQVWLHGGNVTSLAETNTIDQ